MTAEAVATHDVNLKIDQLEKQFTGVDNRVIGLSRDVTGIMTAVDKIGNQVSELTRVVTTMQAAPKFDAFKWGALIVAVIAIFTATATGITYIANSVSYPAILKVQFEGEKNLMRANWLEERLNNGWFKPSSLRINAPGGSVQQTP